ncbi:MAG: ATP-binding protein [Persicimonas sp.]
MTASDAPLIDRERQLEELRALSARPGPQLALLYGRRRVGKTYLLDRAWGDERSFYFLAGDTTPTRNRIDLLGELGAWTGRDIDPDDYPNWRTVFRLLADLARDEPLVIILDEFQYLMGRREGIVSQLNAVWDREVEGRDLTIVLCGSAVATMKGLESGDSPLYGRINWRERLTPFDYRDAARMVPERARREQAYLYGVYGGIPQYLAAIGSDEPLDEAVVRTFLSHRGEIHLQLENLIEQEKGIRDAATYRAVLEAVARGYTGTNEIAQAAGMQGQTDSVRRILETLEELELIWRERNFDAGSRAPWRNRIADNAVRFFYQFVHPQRSRLARGGEREVWTSQVEPNLDTYMGKVYETICRQAFRRHHARWGLPAAVRWARWEGQDRNRRPIEIDIVAELDDGLLLTGEVKWSSTPVDFDLHFNLVRDLEDLGHSGRGWARGAHSVAESHGHIYFSAAGFTDAFEQRAADNDRIHLVTLDDLYVE